MTTNPSHPPLHGPRQQRGIALIMALILLLISTLAAIAAMRTTLTQHQMSSNLYDRELAFQSAESGMRAGIAALAANPALIARNCQAAGVTCPANPFTDTALPSGSIQTVAAGTNAGQFTASKALTAQPQYVIENLGNWPNPVANTGFNQSANSHNYGAQGTSSTAIYYRITARSGDPTLTGGRATVTLQAVYKQD